MSEHAPAVVVSRLPHGTAATEAPAAAKSDIWYVRSYRRELRLNASKSESRLEATMQAPMSDGGRHAATTPGRLFRARLAVQALIEQD